MSECSLSGRGQGHVSNFYIVDVDRTDLGQGNFLPTVYTVLKENSGISKTKGTSFWYFVPKSGLRICFGISIVDKGGRLEHYKQDRRQSTKLTIPACDDRPLVYRSYSSSVYSTIPSRGSTSDS